MSFLVFNELSEFPCCDKTTAYQQVDTFLDTYKKSKDYNFNGIRFHKEYAQIVLSENLSLADYCAENRTKGTLLRGLFRHPFIDDHSEEEKKYIENEFILIKNNQPVKPYGLAVAYLYSAPSIALSSEPFWGNVKFDITVSEKSQVVYCVSKPEHFCHKDLLSFIESKTPVALTATEIKPEEKEISLRDDHGKDTLKALAVKLCHSVYVEKIINSLPYNPRAKEFIKKVYPNGNIEIVLTKTDKGLGLVVKTTGKNRRETEEIAKILECKYNG